MARKYHSEQKTTTPEGLKEYHKNQMRIWRKRRKVEDRLYRLLFGDIWDYV